MFGNVTALVGWIYIGEIQEQKHAAHMLQACGLGSSQVMSPCVLLRAAGRACELYFRNNNLRMNRMKRLVSGGGSII